MQASGQEAHSILKGAMRAKRAKRGQKNIVVPGYSKRAKRAKRGQKGIAPIRLHHARQGHLGVGFPEL